MGLLIVVMATPGVMKRMCCSIFGVAIEATIGAVDVSRVLEAQEARARAMMACRAGYFIVVGEAMEWLTLGFIKLIEGRTNDPSFLLTSFHVSMTPFPW